MCTKPQLPSECRPSPTNHSAAALSARGSRAISVEISLLSLLAPEWPICQLLVNNINKAQDAAVDLSSNKADKLPFCVPPRDAGRSPGPFQRAFHHFFGVENTFPRSFSAVSSQCSTSNRVRRSPCTNLHQPTHSNPVTICR